MLKVFSGKVVLVTGSGKKNGIGYGIAKYMAENGANVVITDVIKRNSFDKENIARAELTSILEELKFNGQNHLAIEADLTNQSEIISLFDQIENSLGPVSILVNNAGICPVKPLLNTSFSVWDLTL